MSTEEEEEEDEDEEEEEEHTQDTGEIPAGISHPT